MKRFSFGLQKLLELRDYEERESETALGRAIGELVALENQLKALAEERAAVAADRFAKGKSGAEMYASNLYLIRLEQQKTKLLAAAAKAELAVEIAREAYRAALQKRKVLDKLKEKQRELHRKTALAEEVKAVDDITQARFGSSALAPTAAPFNT